MTASSGSFWFDFFWSSIALGSSVSFDICVSSSSLSKIFEINETFGRACCSVLALAMFASLLLAVSFFDRRYPFPPEPFCFEDLRLFRRPSGEGDFGGVGGVENSVYAGGIALVEGGADSARMSWSFCLESSSRFAATETFSSACIA